MSLSVALRPRKHARHAKPSKAAPLLVAGGMTMALAATDAALVTSSASATATNSAWERLAGCESGGNWAINTGNGYYGGLQFALATWRGLGMSGYPHQASKATQIAAADQLHTQRGFQPWPACSRKLGLTGDGGGAAPVAAKAPTPAKVAPHAHPAPAPENSSARRVVASRSRASTVAPAFSGRTMTVADRGTYRTDVRDWQQQMRARGWKITVDGFFGPQSSSVAARFAAEKGLRASRGTVDAAAFVAAWTAKIT